MLRQIAALAVLASATLVPRTAPGQTQPWLADRRYGEGAGVLSGNLELHPGIAAELGYDSNFFQAAGPDPNPLLDEPVYSAARLRVTPSLSLRTLGPERRAADGPEAAAPKANFALGAALRLDKLFALDGPEDGPANATLFGGDVGAEVDVGPSEPLGAAIGAAFSRVAHPTSDPGVVGGLDHNRYGGHIDFRWRPGGGVLSWSLGYAGLVTQFDDTRLRLDRAEHGLRTRGRYRFLPRTALLYEGELGVVQQLHPGSRLANAAPISSQLGLNGLVTTRLAVLVMGGFKAMFFDPTESGSFDDFDGAIGRGELTWFLGASPEDMSGPEDRGLSHLRLGVQRDVAPGGIGNYYETNRGFIGLTWSAGGVFVLNAKAGYALIVHATPRDDAGQPLTTGGGQIVEQRPDAGLYAEYRILPTVALLGNLEYSASQPDNYVIVDTMTLVQDNLKYSRFTALFGGRWFL
jgi:phage tail protein X